MHIEMYRCIGDVVLKREANVVLRSIVKRRFVRSKEYRGSKIGCPCRNLKSSRKEKMLALAGTPRNTRKGSLTFQQMQAISNCKSTLLQAPLLFSFCSSSSVDDTGMHAGLVTHIHPSAFIDHNIKHLLRII